MENSPGSQGRKDTSDGQTCTAVQTTASWRHRVDPKPPTRARAGDDRGRDSPQERKVIQGHRPPPPCAPQLLDQMIEQARIVVFPLGFLRVAG